MGMVTLAHANLYFSIETKNEQKSAFSLDTFSDRPFAISTAVSLVLLIASTVLGIFHTVLRTTTLDLRQWLICAAAALPIVAPPKSVKWPGGGSPLRFPRPPRVQADNPYWTENTAVTVEDPNRWRIALRPQPPAGR
jgi:Cation transporting ATPase, C-terminus/YycE-like C-terminal domain